MRVYLPPDANTLLHVTQRCLRSRDKINVIIAGKQPALQYLDITVAARHVEAGAGIWGWASNDQQQEPEAVLASCGDIATQEALAATTCCEPSFPICGHGLSMWSI